MTTYERMRAACQVQCDDPTRKPVTLALVTAIRDGTTGEARVIAAGILDDVPLTEMRDRLAYSVEAIDATLRTVLQALIDHRTG